MGITHIIQGSRNMSTDPQYFALKKHSPAAACLLTEHVAKHAFRKPYTFSSYVQDLPRKIGVIASV